jgi:hypothetical protein
VDKVIGLSLGRTKPLLSDKKFAGLRRSLDFSIAGFAGFENERGASAVRS